MRRSIPGQIEFSSIQHDDDYRSAMGLNLVAGSRLVGETKTALALAMKGEKKTSMQVDLMSETAGRKRDWSRVVKSAQSKEPDLT